MPASKSFRILSIKLKKILREFDYHQVVCKTNVFRNRNTRKCLDLVEILTCLNFGPNHKSKSIFPMLLSCEAKGRQQETEESQSATQFNSIVSLFLCCSVLFNLVSQFRQNHKNWPSLKKISNFFSKRIFNTTCSNLSNLVCLASFRMYSWQNIEMMGVHYHCC